MGEHNAAAAGRAQTDFGRLGDSTSWGSALVLVLILPLSALCLAPFAAVAAAFLPGDFAVWLIVYFAALPVVLVPGLEFLQAWLVCPGSRRPTPEEAARLMPLWQSVLSGVGKGRRRRYRLRVADDDRANAAAGGGKLVIVTTRAIQSLPDLQLEAVLAHELGHHVGLHPIVLLAQQWLARPLNWAARLSVVVHNLVARLTGLALHPVALLLLWAVVLLIRLVLLALDAIVRLAWLLLLFLGRRAEYNADKVATRLGYGQPLIEALAGMQQHHAARGQTRLPLPASSFWDTHPPTNKRIAKIHEALART